MKDLNNLYNKYYATVKSELRKWGCNSFVIDDIIHEAFIIFMKDPKISGRVNRNTRGYLIQMCKHIWIQELRKQSIYEYTDRMDEYPDAGSEKSGSRMYLLIKHLNLLSETCRDVLILFSLNYSEQKISKILNLGSVKAAKNKKYYCKEKLQRMIKSDPLYSEING